MNYPHLSLFVKRVTHSQSQEICFLEHLGNIILTFIIITY